MAYRITMSQFSINSKLTRTANRILRASGWTPSREVDVSSWIEALVADNWTLGPMIEPLLRNYGGLTIRAYGTWLGIMGGRRIIDVNPIAAIGIAYSDVYREEIEPKAGEHLCPIGTYTGECILSVGRAGGVYVCFENRLLDRYDNWIQFINDNCKIGIDISRYIRESSIN